MNQSKLRMKKTQKDNRENDELRLKRIKEAEDKN